MRKYLATFAVLITLFGMFAPYGFSVGKGFEKQKADAVCINGPLGGTYAIGDYYTSFDPAISVEKKPNVVGTYVFKTKVTYVIRDCDPDDHITLHGGTDDVKLAIYKTNQSNQPDGLMLEKDATLSSPLKQNVLANASADSALPDGNYLAYFYQDNIIQQDTPGARIFFTVANNDLSNVRVDTTGINQDDDISFSVKITNIAIDPAAPTKAVVSGKVYYRDLANPNANGSAPVNLAYNLFDAAGTIVGAGDAPNVPGNINDPNGISFSYTLTNLTAGNTYSTYVIETELTSSAGRHLSSKKISFTAGTPVAQGQIQQPQGGGYQNPDNPSELQNGFECTQFWQFRCHLVMFTVDIITFVPMAIATLTGLLSDVFLSLAIDPTMYGAGNGLGVAIDGFLHTSWAIVRDFANIGFIFALFVAAFSLIAGKDFLGFKPKDTVVRVIVMALLVNFSFFFCRMIIQTADVLSNVLYNQLEIQTSSTGTIASWATNAGIKSPSFALVSQVNPQSLFTAAGVKVENSGSFTAYLIVGFLGGAAYWIMIFVFVSMMFVWIGRIFGAWIAIILSPLAFVSWSIPFLEKDKYIGFTNWLTNLVQLAFMVPVYLFFIYIVIGVLNLTDLNKVVSGLDSSSGYLVAVMAIVMKTLIPLLGAMYILIRAKKIAYDMSGEIGVMVNGLAGKASALALGAATGGTAFMARQTLGRAGANIANSGAVKKLSRSKYGSLLGAGIGAAGRATAASSFDVRNSPSIMKRFGQFTEKAGEKIDLGNKMLNTTGFKGEGGLRDIKRNAQGAVESKIMEWNKKTMENQMLDDSSNAQRDKREADANKTRADQALAAEQSKIEFEAQNQTLVGALDKLTNQVAALGGDLDGMNTERNDLKAISPDARTDEQQARLEKLNKDIPLLEKTKKQEANAKIAQAEGATDVRSAQQIAANLKAVAGNSREKGTVDDAKKGLDDAKIKMTTTNKEIADLHKDLKNLNETDDAELYAKTQADIAKKKEDLVKDRKAFDDSRSKHKSAEDDYKLKYGDRIKGLESFAKETVDNYKSSDDVRGRVQAKQNVVVESQIAVNNYQTKIDDANYQNQSEYMGSVQKTAENIANPRDGWKGNIDRVMGAVTGNASMRSADSFRQDLNSKKTTAKIEPKIDKKDVK